MGLELQIPWKMRKPPGVSAEPTKNGVLVVILWFAKWFFIKVIHRSGGGWFIHQFKNPGAVFLLIARMEFRIVRCFSFNHSENNF